MLVECVELFIDSGDESLGEVLISGFCEFDADFRLSVFVECECHSDSEVVDIFVFVCESAIFVDSGEFLEIHGRRCCADSLVGFEEAATEGRGIDSGEFLIGFVGDRSPDGCGGLNLYAGDGESQESGDQGQRSKYAQVFHKDVLRPPLLGK